jgi:nitrate/nitrite transport system ATP-binding protein
LQDEIARIWRESQKTIVLITNDVDEGLLLADRIIPLSAGPSATLGPATVIDLPRPRDRKALMKDPAAKRMRLQVIEYLLGEGRRRAPTQTVAADVTPTPERSAVAVVA